MTMPLLHHRGQHRFTRQESLIYGEPASAALAVDAATAGWNRALIVTTRRTRETRLMAEILATLGARVAGVYAEVSAHSPVQSVLDAAAQARALRADVLIAIGGGSAIDACKVVRTCIRAEITAAHALLDGKSAVMATARAPSMIAVPTTLSAAEFTNIAGITDPVAGTKHVFDDPELIPRLVILDPAATLETPLRLFLGTGVRAVDHCVETLCSAAPTPFGDATAAKGLELLSASLVQVAAEERDLAARVNCQIGAWLAISGPASGVPVGASHAIGRVLGGAFGVPHGETSCVLLPGILRWNAVTDDAGQAGVLAAMGSRATTAADAVAELVKALGLPRSLREIGVDPGSFVEIAEKSLAMLAHPVTAGNRRPVTRQTELLEILELVAD